MKLSQAPSVQSRRETDKYAKIIHLIVSSANEHIHILMQKMLNTADNKLFDLAEKANSNEEQMKYLDCTRIFHTEKNDISGQFFINLNNSLSATASLQADNNEQELSLVDQDEMEEMVAITTMHAKAMNLYGEDVTNLETRLEYLEIKCTDMFAKDALDPKHFCEVFQKTIESIDISIDVKLVFYKLFDQEVCTQLGLMYKSLNKILIDNGIMAQIVLKTASKEDVHYEHFDDEVSTRVAQYYDPSEKVATHFIPRSDNEISHIVNDFMCGEMTASENEIALPESFLRVPTQQDIEGKNCYERNDVIQALSALQHKLTSQNGNDLTLTTAQIKQELVTDISKNNGGIVDKQVNLLDERSIDFVGMMFGAIADDETVSELMTNLIYQLQIPVMKIAMSDRSLFKEENHPARETVDLLTSAGKGINQKNDKLYSDLESVVDSILDEFDIDISIFENAVSELEKLIHTEEQASNETERQQQQQVLQKHARHVVISQLKMVTCDRRIPLNVRPLILKHWSTLMLNRYIRHGRDSQQWVQSVLLLKLLLKCMQPIKYSSQLELVQKNRSALLEAVNDELYQTQQNKDDVAEQIAELKTHFLQMIESYELNLVDNDDKEISSEEILEQATDNTEEELHRIRQVTEIARQKIAQLTSSTKPGVWYELYNGEDKPIRRLKLSVILTDAAQLIFVNRKGIKVIEKDAEEFAKELDEDRSRILADHSTFDHALGKVMKALAA